ncbi:winged helix-turn-helix domain-containing protein [Streptomyces europaeiscabiei]|nr:MULTISPECIES: winged helix-turn-helix domain-containing protein [Streptomyces]MDX3630757.1 winged helix-turn-helix domain-containing protein [Streptomyces europaeiscabiei]MDX3649229.1 winged helix-turn-helix domain-containing protein [Streptomyces europaeiscabiei]WUD38707.1 helix-turn-helix domain-containing protein [Streptomyces europaeiscabiei]
MARAPGRVFTRRGPLTQVWGEDFFGDERVVDVHIRTLRRAIGDDARASPSSCRMFSGWIGSCSH